MILNTSFTELAFLDILSRPWGGHHPESFDGLIYLGAGYWRLRLIRDASYTSIVAARLVNPDLAPDAIAAAEKGLAVILGLPYKEDERMGESSRCTHV